MNRKQEFFKYIEESFPKQSSTVKNRAWELFLEETKNRKNCYCKQNVKCINCMRKQLLKKLEFKKKYGKPHLMKAFLLYVLKTSFKTITPWKKTWSKETEEYKKGWNDCIKEVKKARVKYIKFVQTING